MKKTNLKKLWVSQGSYRSINTGKPMVLVLDKETGATVLQPLYKSKNTTMEQTYKNDFEKVRQERAEDMYITYPENYAGYMKINTPSHGYLIVPKNTANQDIDSIASRAIEICEYGYITDLAVYLEEDREAALFINTL